MIFWSTFYFRGTAAGGDTLSGLTVVLSVLFCTGLVFATNRMARTFALELSSLDDDTTKQMEALKTIGALPVRTLIVATLLSFLFVCSVNTSDIVWGSPENQRIPLWVYGLALALLSSSFSYVLADRLVCRRLFSSQISRYPRNLRENRQQIKLFVVPAFILVMTILFSSTLIYLVMTRAAAQGVSMEKLAFAGADLLAFFIVTIFLIINSNKSTILVLKSVVVQLDQLSSGKRDLTQRVMIGSVDEVGTISGLVNEFSQNLLVSVDDLKAAQSQLKTVGEELSTNAKSSALAVQGISRDVDSVREKSQLQRQSVAESSSAVEQIAKNIESLDGLIGSQGASITQASSAIEEMVGNVSAVTTSIQKMAEEFGGLSAAAQEGQATLAASSERIKQISSRSKALMEANKVISNIASQTNLLAMNAAIEAAHAGEAGRGFSVVADEIRKLAETSAKNSQTIRTELAQVQKAIEEVVKTSLASEAAFTTVSGKIKETDFLVQEIHHGMKEQKEGSGQILSALKAMNEISEQVRSGSSEMREGNTRVLTEMGLLHRSSVEIGERLESMAQNTGAISTSAMRVSSLAEGTEETIGKMENALGTFITKAPKTR